ncbi:hypothetical protein [Magnetospirillum sp. SS-4]|uniref:hypothetical protein n=1 Tax=Magnetospirillum sp. SS-4 TaxID=2681465 RepID=UPI0013823358|nr:hypothetical protein [Magnetospirillum sp. SS-4]CAA7619894.1 conserved exported hypothetical protein [Magnetospirillum sp. SS-4]
MALSAQKIGSAAASAVAAASYVGAGGRNVASATRANVEKIDFAQHIGVNEESILHFRQENTPLNPDGRRQQREQRQGFTPLLARSGGFSLDALTERESETPRLFLTDVMRGIGSYEENLRVTSPASVKPGSVMNYLF